MIPIFLSQEVGGVGPMLSICFSIWLVVFSTSYVLHLYPSLLHRRKGRKGVASNKEEDGDSSIDPRYNVTFIAHRGCRLEGIPENTLAAFQHAVECNADVLEFDVWLTKDGQVVVFHDHDLERMTGIKDCSIPSLAYPDLPSILIKPEIHSGVNDKNRKIASRIPLFSEVLELNPGLPMIIEFKQKNPELIRKVHDMISLQGIKDKVIWFSLLEDINAALRAYDASIPNIASVGGMLKMILFYYAGLLPFMSIEEDILGIPVDEVDYARVRHSEALSFLPDSVCRILATVLGGKPPRPLIPQGLFTHLRARGIPTFFLGVNDDKDIDIAIQAGATAVLTDRPSWLSKRIKEGALDLKKLADNF